MRVVLAHDSFTQLGGAERVFLGMAEAFPGAPIYTVAADQRVLAQLPDGVRQRIRTSPLQWLYKIYPRFQHLLPFIPLAIWLTRLPVCDVLLSSSSAFAKGFRKPAGSRHVNYCHTPTRFLWTDAEYFAQEVPWLVRIPARAFLWWMQRWDLRAAGKVDVFIANSKEVQGRIQKYYGRESTVVYPFVDTQFWHATRGRVWSGPSPHEGRLGGVVVGPEYISTITMTSPRIKSGAGSNPSSRGGGLERLLVDANGSQRGYFLIAGRLHAHKQNDVVIGACNELGLHLHVVGSGRDEARLKSIAGPTIKFLGRVSDETLRNEYSGAQGYIYPQLEDFGLMPVEAAACGTATIGISAGGSRETIVPGKTGEWFEQGNKEQLKAVLRGWVAARYDGTVLRAHAEEFGKDKFVNALGKIVNTQLPIANSQ